MTDHTEGELMSFRRAMPIFALATLLLTAPVSAAERTVDVQEYSFAPGGVTAALGDQVTWVNKGDQDHTSTRSAFPSWSLSVSLGDSASRTFRQSGTFAYICNIHHSMHGTVKVPAQASPSGGGTSTTFTIRVASVEASSGSTYVIQRKAPGGTFKTWKTTTHQTVAFKSSVKGKWTFRSQIKKLSNGQGSAFSPSASVTIG